MAAHGLSRNLQNAFRWARQTEKWTALVLLFVLLLAAFAGVTITLSGPDWSTLWWGLLLGLLLGWTLGALRQSIWRAIVIIIPLGLLHSLLFAGGLISQVMDAIARFIHLFPGLLLKSGNIDLSLLARSLDALFTSTSVILTRVWMWAGTVIAGQPIFDPVVATLGWTALAWLMSAWAGWIVEVRRSALLAVLPAVLLSVSVLAYGERMSVVLYLMLGSLLLLLAVIQQEQRQQSWNEAGVAHPAEKGRQIVLAALLATIALVTVSAFVSSIPTDRIRKQATQSDRDSAQQGSSSIKPQATGPVSILTQNILDPGLPKNHLIGSGPELSQRTVMTVSVPNLPALLQTGQTLPLYWRSFTYDVYTGHGWRSSQTEQSAYRANQLLQAEQAPDHILLRQEVRPVEDLSKVVYADGELIAVDLSSQAAWRSSSDLFGVQLDATSPYEVMSLVPMADERALRAAGQYYPDWVRQRYLALPAEVPNRVKELAIELTASEPTPYDRVRAIEGYLRTIPYTLDVPRPPANQDVVGYFLFDLRKGYCDYYASAMVVMARAAGIPTRLVTGFASGTYNLNSKRFVVTEADAHSWVEVYFPGVGWVPFEPTAARPLLQRTEQVTPEKPLAPTPSAQTSGTKQPFPSFWGWLALLSVVISLGIVGGGWAIFDELRLDRLSERAAAVEVYWRIRRYGLHLDVVPHPGDTPYEYLASLATRLRELTSQDVDSAFGPRSIRAVHSIADGIVRLSYRPSRPRAARRSSVLRQWRRLRWQLRLARILKNWDSIRRRFKAKLIVGAG